MQNAQKNTVSIFQETGTVVESPEGLLVETSSGRFGAVRAVSCLVAPEPGDHVLLAVPPAGDLYVLAVLGRPTDAPIRLCLDTDAKLECAGELSVLATDGLELRSPTEVRTTAARITATSVETLITSERATLVASVLEAHTKEIKSVLGIVDTVVERLSQRVKRSYRFIEELDLTRAKDVDVRAAETFNVRGRNTFMTAEELVKMQGEQIHMG